MHGVRDVDRPRVGRRAARVHDDALAARVRVPRFHGRALVGAREVGQHRVARIDLLEVALDDFALVSLGAAAEVALHGIDRLVPCLPEQFGRAAAVFLRERRSREVDAFHAHYSRAMTETNEFVALGHAGSEHYVGLETFPNPGVSHVELTSDELTAICPITAQPDLYNAAIAYEPGPLCLESKALKIYLSRFRNEGAFCEALAVRIRDDVAEALELPREMVHVTLKQKARGGITITAAT